MRLNSLLTNWLGSKRYNCEITNIQNDSRKVEPGSLFFAYPGVASDGREFINKAITAGAAAIAYEPTNWPSKVHLPNSIPCVAIEGLKEHMPIIASRFYGDPTCNQHVIGVTGTNGKTTIAYQLAQAHELLSHPAAYIGTLGQGEPGNLTPLVNTTPDALMLQALCYEYQNKKIFTVCMEVSSHALSQYRVDGIVFEQAIFTNLTLDHLDYHLTMDSYAAAKAKLFCKKTLKYAIINHDDPYAYVMMKELPFLCKKLTYGLEANVDVQALSWKVGVGGTEIAIKSPWGSTILTIKALGMFNVYNALAVFASLMASGYPIGEVTAVLPRLRAAPGRMEVINQQPTVVVDYAHTPDALENVLLTLTELKKGRLIVVFGCGGDRDKSKRPLMGNIAAQHADHIIITSDNPRTEDPLQIMREVEEGIKNNKAVVQQVDRKLAIIEALKLATADDIVVVAGKGHEAYQQIGKEKLPFSDQEIIREFYANA